MEKGLKSLKEKDISQNSPDAYQSIEMNREKPIIVLFNIGLPDGKGDFATLRAFTRALEHETQRPVIVQVRRSKDEEQLRALFTPDEQKHYIRPFDRSIQGNTDMTIACPLTVDETQFRLGNAKKNYYVSEYDPSSLNRLHIPKELLEKKHIWRNNQEHILCRAGFHPEALGIHIDPDVPKIPMPTTSELATILEGVVQFKGLGKQMDSKKLFSYQGEPFVLLYNHVNSYECRDLIRDLSIMCEQKKEEMLLFFSGQAPSFLEYEHYGDERGKRLRVFVQDHFPQANFLKLLKVARLALVTGDMSVSEAVALGTPFVYDAPPWKRGFGGVWRSYMNRTTALLDLDEEVQRLFFLMGIDPIKEGDIKKLRRTFVEQSQNIPYTAWLEQEWSDRINGLHSLLFNPEDRALVAKYHQRLREQHNFAKNFINQL